MTKLQRKEPSLYELEKAFGDDENLMLFYIAWLKYDMNSTKAYLELHPSVTEKSASVLGSKMLANVRNKIGLASIASTYGLTLERYLIILREGLQAWKYNEADGTKEPDHATRYKFHEKLGKLLDIENTTNNFYQTNIANIKLMPAPILGGLSCTPTERAKFKYNEDGTGIYFVEGDSEQNTD